MPDVAPTKIVVTKHFDALAVSSTTTYRGPVWNPDGTTLAGTIEATSTAAGTLAVECNEMSDADYQAAVTSAGTEAANTAGWVLESALQTGSFFDAATPATALGNFPVAAANKGTVKLGPGPGRRRFTYTNASGSGFLTLRAHRQYTNA